MIDRGVVYFTAGIWPFMGVFVYAIDAESGRLLWHNDRASAVYNEQPGATAATFGGASPQGALVVNGDRLVVPSGRAWPAYFDLKTGAMQPYAAGIKDTAGGGDSRVAAVGDYLLMGGCAFSIAQQRALLLNASTPTVTPYTALPVLDRQTLYVSGQEFIETLDLSSANLHKLTGAYGRPLTRCDATSLWKMPVQWCADVMIQAGPRLYLAGAGRVWAVDAAADGRQATVVWQAAFEGANLGGFRPGCKNSLIPADGLLNAPNYASGCTCNYPVFTSLAMAPMADVEQWSTNDYAYDGSRVRRLGINLGAPGDRRADDGTLWLDFPSVGGRSPDVPVVAQPAGVRWFYRHSSRIQRRIPGWIAGSGAEGIENLDIHPCDKQQPAKETGETVYTVRLYFAECEDLAAGQRVFSVLLQDKEVLHDLDLVRETGMPNVGLMKEFRGIRAADRLSIHLLPKTGRTLLCGVELVAEP